MQNDLKGGKRMVNNKSFLCNSFFNLRFKKVVLLTCRSARKRNSIARSLGGEGNRIVHSFGGKGIRIIIEIRGRE